MHELTIDGLEVTAAEGETILRAAERAGIDIPHFCYHAAFPPEGNCRMCVVEVEGRPKLELACSTTVRDGMVVRTDGDRVRESRRAVLEFLLADHPLDCPVCDKAGECRLQDYYRDYGLFASAFDEPKAKRSKLVPIGPELVLDRERCILCTRCVRFLDRVTGTRELGVFERGNKAEVGIREGAPVETGYAGNLVDLCPVGAITDRVFRFSTRAWFLEPKASFCPLCGRGCEIWIDEHPGFARTERARRVFRVRPRDNARVNGSWMCDAGRRGFVALDRDRAGAIQHNKGGRRTSLSWNRALLWAGHKVRELASKGRSDRIAVVLNSFLSNEELFLARRLFGEAIGAGTIAFLDPPPGPPDGFLRTSRRSPNRNAVRRLGLDPAPPDWDGLSERSELVFLFAHPLMDPMGRAQVEAAWRPVRTKILLAPRASGLEEDADLILPTALPAEKAGSWTGVDGVPRAFEPALEPPGEAAPEWRILTGLAKELEVAEIAGWDSFARVREAYARIHP